MQNTCFSLLKNTKSLDWFIIRFFRFSRSPSASLNVFAATLARLMRWNKPWVTPLVGLIKLSFLTASIAMTHINPPQPLGAGRVLVYWWVATFDFRFDFNLTFHSKVEIATWRRWEALNANEAPRQSWFGRFDFSQCFFTHRRAVWEVGSPLRCSSRAADVLLKILLPIRKRETATDSAFFFFKLIVKHFERVMVLCTDHSCK